MLNYTDKKSLLHMLNTYDETGKIVSTKTSAGTFSILPDGHELNWLISLNETPTILCVGAGKIFLTHPELDEVTHDVFDVLRTWDASLSFPMEFINTYLESKKEPLAPETKPYIMTQEEYSAVELLLCLSYMSDSVLILQDKERGDYFKDLELNYELSLADGLELYWQEGCNREFEGIGVDVTPQKKKTVDDLFDKIDSDHTVPFEQREKKYKKVNGVFRIPSKEASLNKLEAQQKKLSECPIQKLANAKQKKVEVL